MDINIIYTDFNWKNVLQKRKATNYIVNHHRAGQGNVNSIHIQHISQGYSGIGYHFYIRFDGTIYSGRPLDKVGAHCLNYNDVSIGICYEGNFEIEKPTPEQIKSGQELIKYLLSIYPNAKVVGHRDLVPTKCPGKNFNIETLKASVKNTKKLSTGNDIVWELMNGELKVPISEIKKAVNAIEKAKNNEEFDSLYWILYKIVNKEH